MSYIQLVQWLSKSILKMLIDRALTMSDGSTFHVHGFATMKEKS